jgi:hypothetical protein
MIRGAEFSEDGKYRYQLFRVWDESKKIAMCIGLNPSNANATKDDSTIRILIGSLRHLGYGGLKMVNLYALITPKPSELFKHNNPLGMNNEWVQVTAYSCQEIIFCWGAFKKIEYRANEMKKLFPSAKCFGKNQDGSPMHPRAMTYAGIKYDQATLMEF